MTMTMRMLVVLRMMTLMTLVWVKQILSHLFAKMPQRWDV